MKILNKHLMRFARHSEATCDIEKMGDGKKGFARALANSMLPERECISLVDWIEKTRELEKEIRALTYGEILQIQVNHPIAKARGLSRET